MAGTEGTTTATEGPTERDFNELLLESPGLRDIERGLAGFNIFQVMRFADGELRHSNVLAWLLAPGESHGLGDRFLRRWLMRVHHDASATLLDIARVDFVLFRSVQVQREWAHIDLLVRIQLDDGEEWVVAVENKVHATQSKLQLARYRSRLEATFPKAKRLLVFLTLREEEPEDPAWISADYGQVLNVLQECVAERGNVLGAEPRVLIDHYIKTIEGLLMPDEKLVELARRIYDRHHRALDFIFDQRIDETAVLSELVAKRMREAAPSLAIVPMRCAKGFVRYLPKAWDVAANRKGSAWGSTESAYILCEIALSNNQPSLKIVEGSSPTAWRENLYDVARRETASLKVRSKMPAQWMSIYVHKFPKPSEDLELEDAADQIWKACEEHLKNDTRFRDARKIVENLIQGLPPA